MNLALILLGLAVVLVLLVRHHIRLDAEAQKATKTQRNDHLMQGGFASGGPGGGHSHVWRVSRDPQTYAKGFVPGKDIQENRTDHER